MSRALLVLMLVAAPCLAGPLPVDVAVAIAVAVACDTPAESELQWTSPDGVYWYAEDAAGNNWRGLPEQTCTRGRWVQQRSCGPRGCVTAAVWEDLD